MSDRHILRLLRAIDLHPHRATDFAVQLGYTVDLVGKPQADDSHAGGLLRIGRIFPRNRLEIAVSDAALGESLRERRAHHVNAVSIVAGGNGSVRGEDGACAHGLDRIGMRHS